MPESWDHQSVKLNLCALVLSVCVCAENFYLRVLELLRSGTKTCFGGFDFHSSIMLEK